MVIPFLQHCAAAGVMAVVACSRFGAATTSDAPVAEMVAIVDVTVITMDSGKVLEHQTVLTGNGKIIAISPTASTTIPVGAIRVDGKNRFLFPGLIDSHLHVRDEERAQYLSDGVLTARNMWGYPSLLHDTVSATPWIRSLSPGIDGSPAQWPLTQILDDPAQAERIVASLTQEGWTTFKVYQRLSLASFDSVVAAVKRRGLRFAGHVPTAVPVMHALASGMQSIEHLTGYEVALNPKHRSGTWGWMDVDTTAFPALVKASVQSGVWNCPTMAIYVALAQQHPAAERTRIIANRRAFVKALHLAGARIVAGTDAGIDILPAKGALRAEMRELLAAGLPLTTVLAAATSEGGRLLGVPGLGTVTVGAPAQLLLLDADPRLGLNALEQIHGAVLRGHWLAADPKGQLVFKEALFN